VCGKQLLPPLTYVKSRMRRRARTDLCGGRSVMIVPTAVIGWSTDDISHYGVIGADVRIQG
jgi:hypothetical protein